MKAVLLAAGLGTRLQPITHTIPKCLVPIRGKPLLDYWLAMLVNLDDIEHIYINLHYYHEQVEAHLSKNWPNHKITTWYEEELMGTAGTLRENAKTLANSDLLVIHADNLSFFDMEHFLSAHHHRPRDTEMTMMLFHTDTPHLCGIVELDDQRRVVHMHEKVECPPGNLANGAVYIMAPGVIEYIVAEGMSDLSTQLIPKMLGRILGWLNDDYHRDIGNPESYRLAQADVEARK
ncbi:nucleotidyltransferase family protein [Aestuariibacter sp. A3R04]|uniref:nucleotidyltransferase family protein n=1 Tax=Aestuariibacter sp. A3R04 TaxID=2841571 RepID=UPI001C07F1AE|nr:nucleotidyltransferase family protein [Aestuariibacter sp. A3R04]MBU3022199.1 nucleotidyltransferase family protein [Aestuariibacter sp. A3R04]